MKYDTFLFAALIRSIPLRDKYLASYVQFKLETHTESREIDFYCVVEASDEASALLCQTNILQHTRRRGNQFRTG